MRIIFLYIPPFLSTLITIPIFYYLISSGFFLPFILPTSWLLLSAVLIIFIAKYANEKIMHSKKIAHVSALVLGGIISLSYVLSIIDLATNYSFLGGSNYAAGWPMFIIALTSIVALMTTPIALIKINDKELAMKTILLNWFLTAITIIGILFVAGWIWVIFGVATNWRF